MLSENIKINTKNSHQSLENKLILPMKSIHNQESLARLLVIFYSFFGGLEVNINKHIDTAFLPDYADRRKTAALENDLILLKTALPSLASNDDLPEINNHLQALGALYVIEGSTLGGKFISKMVRQQIDLPHVIGLTFFDGYGSDTDTMWQLFKQFMDQPMTADEKDMVIQSANDTFAKFSQWVDKTNTFLVA
ncbi:bacteriophytochrome heme oxygenase BphO [Arcticibacter svalbardensis MN12-7]|uniref:Bacteriophytochrome heme oxygenase BphO n=1 Tax=Arcticibacter svalbardensis MN12-7 TaxID=1150600 RepID=R9GZ93_9SPHI|nr:biliverdin-producing heme oxygenase [Arcticibacter svalbardensis]EOR94289.1 bacteriophytochrome heme oxygenase BphO [Arcticibacter svalbardensis MN12-7]